MTTAVRVDSAKSLIVDRTHLALASDKLVLAVLPPLMPKIFTS